METLHIRIILIASYALYITIVYNSPEVEFLPHLQNFKGSELTCPR